MHKHTYIQAGQPEAILTQQKAIKKAAKSLVADGFALTKLDGKKPTDIGWNLRVNAITSPDQLNGLDGNIGLLHAYSGTCCIDIDDYIETDEIFNQNGLNLISYVSAPDSVQIVSGRENRAKLLYRTNQVLTYYKHDEDGKTVFELRCATANGNSQQDVLPPSIHPTTGKPYTWQGDYKKLPSLPEEVRAFWEKKSSGEVTPCTDSMQNPHRRNITSVGNAITSMGNPLETPLHDHIKSSQQVRKLFCSEDIQRKLLNFLGFTGYESLFKNGRASVKSVIPPDDNNSGGLILSSSGEILFHDFSGACGHSHVPLQVLYARIIAGRFVWLTPTEKEDRSYGKVTLAVWAARLLVDAGIVAPAKVTLPTCPKNSRKSLQQFYDGVKRLFEVRWAFKDHLNNPIAMGRKFMSAWTGLTEDQCRNAIKDSLKAGVIHTAGRHGRARLYAPGYKPPQPKGRTTS